MRASRRASKRGFAGDWALERCRMTLVSAESAEEGKAPRAQCYVCMKPLVVCVCDGAGARAGHRTEIIVVQHPRERFHPLGTARLVRLGLARAQVVTAWNRQVPDLRVTADARMALLYPSEGSRPLAELAADERPQSLVVLDGTWSQARSLYKHNPWLASLPAVRLSDPTPSRYRIRREPRLDYVSTVEAVVAALRELEPDAAGLDAVLARFEAMIDTQIRCQADPTRRRYEHVRRPRVEKPPTVPASLARLDPRVVVVHTEVFRAWPETAPGRLVVVMAERPATGERFAAWVAPAAHEPALDALQLENLEVTSEQLAVARPLAQVLHDLSRFLRADDAVWAWNLSSLRHLRDSGGPALRGESLKAATSGYLRARCGHLEDVVREQCGEAPASWAPGRAGRRIACAGAMVRWLAQQSGMGGAGAKVRS